MKTAYQQVDEVKCDPASPVGQHPDDWYPKTAKEIGDWVEQNERLFHKLVRSFARPNDILLSYEDLYQVALMGAFRSAMRYDPSRGVKFVTYVYECSRNAILMEMRRYNARSRSAVVVSLELGPNDEGEDMGSRVDNRDVNEQDGLHANADASLDESLSRDENTDAIISIIEKELSPKHRSVLLGNLRKIPQSQIAEELGLSQGAVSKLLKNARCELRVKLHDRGILD